MTEVAVTGGRSRLDAERMEAWLHWPMLFACLLVIPTVILEASNQDSRWSAVGTWLDWGIWLAFLTEAVLMLAVVPSRRGWIAGHPLEVSILVLTLPFLPAALQVTRVLRLLRLLRLMRLARTAKLLRKSFSLDGLRYFGLLAFLTTVGGGVAFAAVERGHQKLSAWDGVWWSFTTITTMSYGDITPMTTAGRAIAICIICVGLGIVALFTAAAAERFMAHKNTVDANLNRLDVLEQEVISSMRDVATRLAALEETLTRREER